jgi:beta-N-acetylhexosaminidase
MTAENLTLEEKIGQMMIIPINETEITKKTIEMIQKYKIGGFILYRKNYNSYNEMLEIVNKLKSINQNNKIPLFISMDQEGGRVYRLPPDINRIKNAKTFAETKDLDLIADSGSIMAKILKKTGINMNYSPVLDIRRFDDNDIIGDRSYGNNAEDVSNYGIEVMKGIQKEGVISVVKHFPGHGATNTDSHFKIPIIKEKIDVLEKEDIKPFINAIKNNADAIMIGHLIVEDIDNKYPASLSYKVIQEYLKDKYGYNGLIISDDIKMLSIKLHYSLKNTIIRAINSGNNVILIGYSYPKIKKIIKIILKEIKKVKIDINKIDESVNKIIQIKEKYNITDAKANGMDINEINKQINKINEKTKNK